MMTLLADLWAFARERKKLWLLPLMLLLLGFGTLLVFAHGSAVAPFIYALF
jgi:cytochrome c-type biogenesis protein CcmH/NrfF